MKSYFSATFRSAIASWLITSILYTIAYSSLDRPNGNYNAVWIAAVVFFLFIFSALGEVIVLQATKSIINRLVLATNKLFFAFLLGLYGLLLFCILTALWFGPGLSELLGFIRFEPNYFEPWSLLISAGANTAMFGFFFYSIWRPTLTSD